MNILNPPVFDHIIELNGASVKVAVVAIGAWDMDASSTVNVTMPLDTASVVILGMTVVIYEDAPATGVFDLNRDGFPNATGIIDGAVNNWSGTTLTLARRTGGQFDLAQFSTLPNRGWITVFYLGT